MDVPAPVTVTVCIEVNGEVKQFRTTASTDGDPHRVADGMLTGLQSTAERWLYDQRWAARRS